MPVRLTSPIHLAVLAGSFLGAIQVPSPASAGFFFEGLEPFSTRACDPGLTTPGSSAPARIGSRFQDPVVQGPADQGPTAGSGVAPAGIEGSPSAFNTGGRPRFQALPCPEPVSPGHRPRRPGGPHVPQK